MFVLINGTMKLGCFNPVSYTHLPLDLSSKPNEAETIPLPKEEVTPPVTKMYFVFFLLISLGLRKVK